MREVPCGAVGPPSPRVPGSALCASLQIHQAGNHLPFLLTRRNKETHCHGARKPCPPLASRLTD